MANKVSKDDLKGLKRSAKLVGGYWRESIEPFYDSEMWETLKRELESCCVVVEVGSFLGCWAWHILREFPEIERLFCVDPWGGPKEEQMRSWCLRLRGDAFVRAFPLHGTSELWASKFDQKIDLLYIDGAHNYEAVRFDLLHWKPKVRLGGMVLCHDYNVLEIKRAVDENLDSVNVGDWGPHFSFADVLTAWKKIES